MPKSPGKTESLKADLRRVLNRMADSMHFNPEQRASLLSRADTFVDSGQTQSVIHRLASVVQESIRRETGRTADSRTGSTGGYAASTPAPASGGGGAHAFRAPIVSVDVSDLRIAFPDVRDFYYTSDEDVLSTWLEILHCVFADIHDLERFKAVYTDDTKTSQEDRRFLRHQLGVALAIYRTLPTKYTHARNIFKHPELGETLEVLGEKGIREREAYLARLDASEAASAPAVEESAAVSPG